MANREVEIGDLVWWDDAYSYDEQPILYDPRNGFFGVITGISSTSAKHIYYVIEVLRYGKYLRGGGRIVGASSLRPAHWTFLGPMCLQWPRYPMHFIGT